jgi:formylglycine-generating enzyme required for sulfatase activity/dienelactone hydrolase
VADPFAQLKQALGDRYRFDRELGAGGMAVVFLARDLKHDREVAIKVVRPELAALMGAERFLREVTIAAQLQHPHILTLIDSGEVRAEGDDRPYLYYVMPRVQGETLRERLEREGKLPPAATARILRDVLDALGHAHQAGFVHRDIKPENVMLAGRHAMVMDFGIARAIADSQPAGPAPKETLTTLGLVIGTPAYMSPEQAAGDRSLDHRTDLYSAGVMAYEMLTGQTPFTGSTPQAVLAGQIGKAPPPLAEVAPETPASLAAAIMRSLEKDPADRWPSAESLLEVLEPFTTADSGPMAAGRPAPRHRGAMAAAGVLVVAVLAGIWWFGPAKHSRQARWAREEAIPQLLALADRGASDTAFLLARQVEAVLPGDSLFKALVPRFARRQSLVTDPPGARIWTKPYGAPDSEWLLLGKTPLDSVLLPQTLSGWGSARMRIEAAGYRTLELVGVPFGYSMRLDRADSIPPEMLRIKGGDLDLSLGAGMASAQTVALGDFLMDRLEVTNREYRAFVDSGGYGRREFWEHPFVRDGHSLSWEEGIALMTDKTGRPGPATWEAGDYPAGQANFPVGGVSWYEAAAYARFRGKSLPTVYHWQRAATVWLSAPITAHSNFGGTGPRAVGAEENPTGFGVYDMAGNVREWCVNEGGAPARFVLGGGWNDQKYQFTDSYTQPPFDRSPINGIRLVKYLTDEPNLPLASKPLVRRRRDFLAEPRIPDAVFEAYRRMYDYDQTLLSPDVMEQVDEGDWTRELVRMRAAYGTDTLLAYLYLPHRGKKPYPTVVYFPGSNAIRDKAPDNLQVRIFDFVLRSGRAVLYPVYKGTYQRSDSLDTDVQNTSSFYRDHVIMWAKDLRRALDYAETRDDLATDRVAYFGVSWGGAMGAIMPVVEPRIRTSVLYVAGLDFENARPEVDPVNFLPRNRVPTLMLNGRYDFFFPLETSQIPMFRLLGTPADQKRHVVEEGSHNVPRLRLMQEILAWLDRYQPVDR